MTLMVGGVWIGKLHKLSVHEVRVTLRAKLDKPGRKRWMLYYQPMCSHHLQRPQLEQSTVPKLSLKVENIGKCEQYYGDTLYRLPSGSGMDVAFAETTVKVTRKMTIPALRQKQVVIRAAANERQSFQLLLQPKDDAATLKSVQVSDLSGPEHVIPARDIAVRRVAFVPIRKSSYITPARFLGDIGDPLVPVTRQALPPTGDTAALWVTVRVAPKTPAGKYVGQISIDLAGTKPVTVPIWLEVYDFELPEFSSFRANMGLQYLCKKLSSRPDARSMLQYHGISSKWPQGIAALKKLSRAYFDVMVANKFTPKSVALYSEIGMNWTPPPQGYNVDKPGNFFALHDWDFSEFNKTLRYFINDKKVNNICLTHTDPSSCNLFQQLPGKRLPAARKSAPHNTMAWQTFRDLTIVAYGKTKYDPYQNKSIEVTKKQWDDLVLKYYRRIARNLDQHGWLDKVHILIDETENPKRLQHFLQLLKSDPLTARIRTAACIQGLGLIHRSAIGNEGRFDFRRLLDIYVPEMDENYDRWMDYYWADHELQRSPEKLWPYMVTSSRLAIDTPGINNRIIGLDIFNRGGSGLLIWETVGWDHLYGKSRNPWRDPYTRHANGSLAYFYPPKRRGLANKPDFSITPSLRLETFRESIDDYEYLRILADLIKLRRQAGGNVADGESVLQSVRRIFAGNTHWSQNDAWYLALRNRAARAIEKLKKQHKSR